MINTDEYKSKKNCLLSFRNIKINNFADVNEVIDAFAGTGYYFDKISHIAYDKSEEIVRAVKDGKENYENIAIYCPYEMESILKKFLENLYASQFNELNILKSQNSNVFILFSDKDNRLRFDDIKTVLDNKYGVKFDRAYIKTVCAPYNEVNAVIKRAKAICNDIDFNISNNFGDCRIEIIYSSLIPKTTHDEVYRTVLTGLNEYVYAMEDVSLAERLFQLLQLRRMKISVAESFTGGGIGKALVDVPGISEVYFEGLNTYSNEAKTKRLGVNTFTLQHYGAVSEQTAHEMAKGLLSQGDCDVCIATTGIAGPKSDNTAKPVGLVYIAIGTQEHISVYKYNLNGNRDNITKTAINLAMFLAYKTLK